MILRQCTRCMTDMQDILRFLAHANEFIVPVAAYTCQTMSSCSGTVTSWIGLLCNLGEKAERVYAHLPRCDTPIVIRCTLYWLPDCKMVVELLRDVLLHARNIALERGTIRSPARLA